jgi:hypothetical protein
VTKGGLLDAVMGGGANFPATIGVIPRGILGEGSPRPRDEDSSSKGLPFAETPGPRNRHSYVATALGTWGCDVATTGGPEARRRNHRGSERTSWDGPSTRTVPSAMACFRLCFPTTRWCFG